MALKILLQGDAPFCASGYGQTSRILLEIFKKLGHQIALFAHYGLEGGIMKWNDIDVYPRGNDPYGSDIVEPHAHAAGADLVITNIDPFVLSRYGERHFAWLPITPVAGDPLSDTLKNSLTGAVDIVSISEYGQQVLKEGGVPSTLVRLPVPTSFYHPIDRKKARDAMRFGWSEDTYVIGNVGMNRGWRKGQDILLRAFQIFLADVPNAVLYMHTDVEQHDGINLKKLIKQLNLEGKVQYPSRYSAFVGRSQYWMHGLYNSFDLYVQPSLNEGQGMPLYEAYSCGLPVVATNATAQTEILDGADAIPVEPRNTIWQPIDCWGYEVTADDLAEGMLQAHRKYGQRYVSLLNRQIAIEKVSVEEISHQWQTELQKVERSVRYTPMTRPWKEKPKVVQISTVVPNCGIGQYTRSLMASMSEATDQECIDILSLGKTTTTLPPCDLIHLHYEGAIWPSDNIIRDIVLPAKYRGTRVVCTYHSALPDAITSHIQDKIVDLALIHWNPPGLQISDPRIMLLGGMGCPGYTVPRLETREDYREERGFTMRDKIISTFGFASAMRGQVDILAHLAPLLRSNPQVKMQMILPENFLNKEGHSIIHGGIRAVARDYGIEDQVFLIPDFLTDLEILTRLWISDLGFLYIDGHTPSTSSAARFFVAARLPLVVSPSSHFEDLRRGVVRTGNFSVPEITQTIWDTLHNTLLRNTLRDGMEINYQQFQWIRFGEKILTAYKKAMSG